MSRPERGDDSTPAPNVGAGARSSVEGLLPSPRYGRYVGLLAVLILVLIAINTALKKSNDARGILPGHAVAPFAAPLATGNINGDVNVATPTNEGAAGKVPACSVRGAGVLNACALYERGPLVLALFVDSASCPAVLSEMQALTGDFPGVSFAGVAIGGERGALRRLIRKRGLAGVQIGFDSDGALVSLYKVASCPQVTFVLPGGIAQGNALLGSPSMATLRARVEQLAVAAKARGWKAPAG
jgi:hypothetical protein